MLHSRVTDLDPAVTVNGDNRGGTPGTDCSGTSGAGAPVSTGLSDSPPTDPPPPDPAGVLEAVVGEGSDVSGLVAAVPPSDAPVVGLGPVTGPGTGSPPIVTGVGDTRSGVEATVPSVVGTGACGSSGSCC